MHEHGWRFSCRSSGRRCASCHEYHHEVPARVRTRSHGHGQPVQCARCSPARTRCTCCIDVHTFLCTSACLTVLQQLRLHVVHQRHSVHVIDQLCAVVQHKQQSMAVASPAYACGFEVQALWTSLMAVGLGAHLAAPVRFRWCIRSANITGRRPHGSALICRCR